MPVDTQEIQQPRAAEVVYIPTAELYTPVWNPRKYKDQVRLQNLVNFIKRRGKLPRVLVWKGTEPGHAPNRALISGQMRTMAHLLLGISTIEAELMDIPLEDAKDLAGTTNENTQVYWLDKYENWETRMAQEHEGWDLVQWSGKFGCSRSVLNKSRLLLGLLTVEARDLIRQNLPQPKTPAELLDESGDEKREGGPSSSSQGTYTQVIDDKFKDSDEEAWVLKVATVYNLIPLNRIEPLEKAQFLALQVLRRIFQGHWTRSQTSKLVNWLLEGKDIDQFVPSMRKKQKNPASSKTPSLANHLKKLIGATEPGKKAKRRTKTNLTSPSAPETLEVEGEVSFNNPEIPVQGTGQESQTQVATPTVPLKATSQPPKAASPGLGADLAEVFQGFTAAGIKDLLGKIPDNKWQAVGYILEKAVKGGGKRLGHLLFVIGKHLLLLITKGIHNIAKSVANWAAPIHSSSGSRSHGSRGGQNPFLYIGHWVVYAFVMAFCYSTLAQGLGQFFPGFRGWFNSGALALFHWAGQAGLFLLGLVFHNAGVFFGLGGLLIFGIIRSYQPAFGWIAAMVITLLLAWHFRGWVRDELQLSLPVIASPAVQAIPVPAAVAAPLAQPTAIPPTYSTPVLSSPRPRAKKLSRSVKTPNSSRLTSKSSVAANPTTPLPAPSASTAPANEKVSDADFVQKFAEALYSIGYLNYQDRETTLLGWVTKDEAGDLKGHYFNPYVLKNMVSIHRTKVFTPDGPVKWIFSNEATEEFTVSGTIAGQGGWGGQGLGFTKTVKARIQIIHDTQGKALVKKIDEQISE